MIGDGINRKVSAPKFKRGFFISEEIDVPEEVEEQALLTSGN